MNPEWVEAGTARLAEVTRERIVSHGEMVEIVIAAVEPLIRADERERAHVHATGTSSGDGPCCQCCYDVADLRAQIAADIEALHPDAAIASPVSYKVAQVDAARIARGEP